MFYDDFLIGVLDTTPQRFLFGLLDDHSGLTQGVFRSSTADKSGVADSSGVFQVKTNPDAAAQLHSVCVYFRQRGGQLDKTCALDPGNKFRLNRTIIGRLTLISLEKNNQENQLDQMSSHTTDITYTLDHEFSIHGKKDTDSSPVRLSLKVAEFNYSYLRKASLKFGKFCSSFLHYSYQNQILTLLDKLEHNVDDQWVSIDIAAAGNSASPISNHRKQNSGNLYF